jgi:hypothetical protein
MGTGTSGLEMEAGIFYHRWVLTQLKKPFCPTDISALPLLVVHAGQAIQYPCDDRVRVLPLTIAACSHLAVFLAPDRLWRYNTDREPGGFGPFFQYHW